MPFCWESLAAWGEGEAAGNENYYSTRVYRNPLEVTRENHRFAPRYEVGWYRRWVQIPKNEAWDGKRVMLTVGAADFFTDAGATEYTSDVMKGVTFPSSSIFTDALQTLPDGTRNGLIVLRVEDPMDNHEQPVGKQWRWYTTCSGIWQTVYIEPRAASYFDSFRVIPDIDKSTAHFHFECVNAGPDCEVQLRNCSPAW